MQGQSQSSLCFPGFSLEQSRRGALTFEHRPWAVLLGGFQGAPEECALLRNVPSGAQAGLRALVPLGATGVTEEQVLTLEGMRPHSFGAAPVKVGRPGSCECPPGLHQGSPCNSRPEKDLQPPPNPLFGPASPQGTLSKSPLFPGVAVILILCPRPTPGQADQLQPPCPRPRALCPGTGVKAQSLMGSIIIHEPPSLGRICGFEEVARAGEKKIFWFGEIFLISLL